LDSIDNREVEGINTCGVRVTEENGKETDYYFYQESLVPILLFNTIESGPQKGGTVETYLNNYQDVGGVFLPMNIEVK